MKEFLYELYHIKQFQDLSALGNILLIIYGLIILFLGIIGIWCGFNIYIMSIFGLVFMPVVAISAGIYCIIAIALFITGIKEYFKLSSINIKNESLPNSSLIFFCSGLIFTVLILIMGIYSLIQFLMS